MISPGTHERDAAGVVGTVRCSRMQSDGADEVGPEADAVARPRSRTQSDAADAADRQLTQSDTADAADAVGRS